MTAIGGQPGTYTIVMKDGRRFRRTCSMGEAVAALESLGGSARYLLDSADCFVDGDFADFHGLNRKVGR